MARPPGRFRPSSFAIPVQSAAGSNNTAIGEPLHHTDTCSVVIFGEAGAGKSSLINLIVGKEAAATSIDAKGCTTAVEAYEIFIQNEALNLKLFDTPGLDECSQGEVPDKKARRILKRHVQNLMKQGDIHLIIYCVRGEKLIRALRRNYKFIHSQVKSKVPIVLVVTSLESYAPDMERWWRLNELAISELGMIFAGHACVTTEHFTQSMATECGCKQSYDAVCKLIKQCRLSNETAVHTGLSGGTIHNLPSASKNIVLFGQAGAGKSSLVDLIAGTNVASRSCALHWQEYPIKLGSESYRVFDTIGIKEPRLGIPQYLDAVENAYTLIQSLERQGGIDLLLFCVRADRLTDTVQSNYRLFHEFLCDKKVPIVVVITHLENEVEEMDAWWKQNKDIFREREIHVAGHVCITAIEGNHPDRYEESRTTIRDLIKELSADGQKQARKGGGSLLVSLTRMVKGLLGGKNMVSRLKRCGMSLDIAQQLANRINNVVEGAT